MLATKTGELTSMKSELVAVNFSIKELYYNQDEFKQNIDDMKVKFERKLKLSVMEMNITEEEYQKKIEQIVKDTYKGLPVPINFPSVLPLDIDQVIEKVKEKLLIDVKTDSCTIRYRNKKLKSYIESYRLKLPLRFPLLSFTQLEENTVEIFDRCFLDKYSPNHYRYITFVALLLKNQEILRTNLNILPELSGNEFWNNWYNRTKHNTF
jgi:hypothetical protein